MRWLVAATGRTAIGAITGSMIGMVASTMTHIVAVISVSMTSPTMIHGLGIIGVGITDRTEGAITIGTRESITIGMTTTSQRCRSKE